MNGRRDFQPVLGIPIENEEARSVRQPKPRALTCETTFTASKLGTGTNGQRLRSPIKSSWPSITCFPPGLLRRTRRSLPRQAQQAQLDSKLGSSLGTVRLHGNTQKAA